jgi:hypothetical protein
VSPLEELDRAFVLHCGFLARKCPEIPFLSGLGIDVAAVQAPLFRPDFSDYHENV